MDTKIFDTLLEPTFIIDDEKKVLYCNEPAALICDLSIRKILKSQKPLDQIFAFAEDIEGFTHLTTVTEATPYQEVSFQTESGKTGKVQITLQPFELHNQKPSWIIFFRDVTLEETLQKKYRAELEKKENVIKDLQKAKEELKHYSENLEKMVAARTAELARLNQLMGALLDSLGQGFFIFNESGLCLEVCSKACESTVEALPHGQKIWDVLKLTETKTESFKKWMTTIFAEMLPFEDLAPLGPASFTHSQGKHIQLEYYPLRSEGSRIEGVVVVATDITNLVQAKQEAEIERAHAKMILNLVKQKRQISGFIREAEVLLHELLLATPSDLENIFRLLHTLKGGAASFSIKTVADLCHQSETALAEWKENSSQKNLFQLQQLLKEIPCSFQEFLKNNQDILGSIEKNRERWIEAPLSQFMDFQQQYLNQQLQKPFTESLLMEPIGSFFSYYHEVIQNTAQQLGKEAQTLVLKNSSLKILPEPYEHLFGTFIHAFRNAVDHGIETPELRQSKGKDPAGKIEVLFDKTSDPHGEWLIIQIQDDGNGIDSQKIRALLKTKGVSCEHETDEQVIQHIFASEFTTRDMITETSGRGVGMDAILIAAKNLGGQAWVKSQLGKGTSLFVRVPYLTSLPSSAVKKSA